MNKIMMNLYVLVLIFVAGNLASAETNPTIRAAKPAIEAAAQPAKNAARVEICYLSATESCTFNTKTADRKLLIRLEKEGSDCYCKMSNGTTDYGHLNNVFNEPTTREDSEPGNADWQPTPRPARKGTTK